MTPRASSTRPSARASSTRTRRRTASRPSPSGSARCLPDRRSSCRAIARRAGRTTIPGIAGPTGPRRCPASCPAGDTRDAGRARRTDGTAVSSRRPGKPLSPATLRPPLASAATLYHAGADDRGQPGDAGAAHPRSGLRRRPAQPRLRSRTATDDRVTRSGGWPTAGPTAAAISSRSAHGRLTPGHGSTPGKRVVDSSPSGPTGRRTHLRSRQRPAAVPARDG